MSIFKSIYKTVVTISEKAVEIDKKISKFEQKILHTEEEPCVMLDRKIESIAVVVVEKTVRAEEEIIKKTADVIQPVVERVIRSRVEKPRAEEKKVVVYREKMTIRQRVAAVVAVVVGLWERVDVVGVYSMLKSRVSYWYLERKISYVSCEDAAEMKKGEVL